MNSHHMTVFNKLAVAVIWVLFKMCDSAGVFAKSHAALRQKEENYYRNARMI